MTKEYREYAKSRIEYLLKICKLDERDKEALELAIQALSQEPCELLIIKSDILLRQDDRKKWAESIKREKESGVIILPPYFEPLIVPNDIEINIEQEPCDDAISRQSVLSLKQQIGAYGMDIDSREVEKLPSVTQKSESVTEFADRCRECGARYGKLLKQKSGKWIKEYEDGVWWKCSECNSLNCCKGNYCPDCGAKMESEK